MAAGTCAQSAQVLSSGLQEAKHTRVSRVRNAAESKVLLPVGFSGGLPVLACLHQGAEGGLQQSLLL